MATLSKLTGLLCLPLITWAVALPQDKKQSPPPTLATNKAPLAVKTEAAAATGQSVMLWAATNPARGFVDVRWIPEEGWLSPQGYNLYRMTGQADVKVNTTPILPDSQALVNDPDLAAIMARAARPLSPVAKAQAKSELTMAETRTLSSASEFKEAVAESASAISTKTPNVDGRLRTKLLQNPRLKALGIARKPVSAMKTRSLTLNPDADTNGARDSLRFSSLMDPSIARILGMQYTVEGLRSGEKYTFSLRAITPAGDVEVRRFSGTVGGDTPVGKPVVEAPVQLGQNHVGLHFSSSSPNDAIENGLTKYNVYRVAGGKRSQLNGDRPILVSYMETTDGKLKANLITFDDASAPAHSTFDYEVEAVDIFGRAGSTTVTCSMVDLAEPLEQPVPLPVGPLQRPSGSPVTGVVLYWVPVRHTTDDNAASIANEGRGSGRQNWESFTYTIDRLDLDNASTVSVLASQTAASPTNLSELTIAQLFKLYPGIDKSYAPFMRASGNETGLTLDMPATELQNQTKYPNIPRYNLPVLKFSDLHPQADHFYEYRLTPVLVRDGRSGEPQSSGKVGIPAWGGPKAPSGLSQTNTFAPADTNSLQQLRNGGATTNAIRRQLSATRMSVTGEELSVSPTPAKPTLVGRLKTRGTMRPTVTGVPSNFGRVVKLAWSPSSNPTPVFYRIYRAVATGYRSLSGASTSVKFRSVTAGQGKAETKAKIQAVRPTLPTGQPINAVTAQARVRGAVLEGATFVDEFLPGPDDYTLLGSTKDGECILTDLVPRSQTTTYYYVVEPVNRWGQAGTRSTPFKVILDPSLKPSVPIVESVNAQIDGTLRLTIETNLSQEKVTRYEVYRMEVPLPAITPPTASAAPGGRNLARRNPLSVHTPPPQSPIHTKAVQTTLFGVTAPAAPASREMDLSNYTLVSTVTPTASAGSVDFTDTTVESNKAYLYRVVAVNVVDLRSDATLPYDGITVKTSTPPPTVTFTASSYDEDSHSITFTVVRPTTGANAYLIERSTDGINWRDLGTRPCTAASTLVVDDSVHGNENYRYRVYAVDFAGNVSTPYEVTIETN